MKEEVKKLVEEEREIVNKEKVADGLKKAVKQAEEKATYRDYSGRIKLGEETDIDVEPIPTNNFNKVIKAKNKEKLLKSVSEKKKAVIKDNINTSVIKPENKADIVKPKDNKGIIKEENINGVIKNNTSLDKGNNNKDKSVAPKRAYKKPIGNKKIGNSSKYSDVNKNSAVLDKETRYSSDIKELSNDGLIVSNSQESNISQSIADYVIPTLSQTEHKTAYSKAVKVKQLELIKQNLVKANRTADNTITYHSDLAEDKLQSNSEMVTDNKIPLSDAIHTDVNPETENKSIKSSFKGRNKRKSDETLTGVAKDKVVGKVLSAIENSDDETLQTTEKVASVANTAVNILKPEKARRKTTFDKAKTAENIKNLSIKQEFKDDIAASVNYVTGVSNKALKTGGKSVISNVRDDIKKYGEDDLSFKAVDDVITTAETARDVKRAYTATKNSLNKAVNTGSSTLKAIQNTPQTAKNIYQKVQETKRKFNAYKKLQTRQRINIIKSKGKQATKKVADLLLKSARDVAVKATAFSLVIMILIVSICGVVVGAIGNYIWDTSSVLDTTKIVKYISSLDYDQQRNWFAKGKTAVEIASKNDNSSGRSYKYIYAIAKDVPADCFFWYKTADDYNNSGINANVMVTVGETPEGETRRPIYSGFNEFYYSSDEFLENNRWTTEDYRAALAYMQVKCENLGWLESHIGFVGENKLKQEARTLVEFTYQMPIVVRTIDENSVETYSSSEFEVEASFSKDKTSEYYYFGRKYSVKYLIDNDILKFSTDEAKQKEQKERFYYTYKYGNYAVAALSFPLALQDGETISSRISKHFGEQLSLVYKPPTPNDKKTVYGKVTGKKATHWATDLSADDGDIIKAPMSGLCIVKQREGRGFEYTISSSYEGNEFKYDGHGYVVKLSCSSGSYIPEGVPTVVTQGQTLGVVANNIEVNNIVPNSENDTENEDIIADCLFPCSTSTTYHNIGGDYFEEYTTPSKNHLHIELYSLPCDFTDKKSVKENILAPELFFDYSSEEED
ncbi:MAG TPA: hypothetical protein DCG28_01730 [Lachnospiraceae bacterium]|nr:hypothetical protein [Lachnospiraceae bacterium]